jgi:SAM-dependent methyltransferase
MMDYEAYLKMQTAGPVYKPERYHEAERIAIGKLFWNIPPEANILDLGCGTGSGVRFLNEHGYENVYGLDLDPRKVEAADHPHILLGDIAYPPSFFPLFDVIYSSHCLEHVFDIEAAVEKMKSITTKRAKFFIILPYPDLTPSPAHYSSPTLGLNKDDKGVTTRLWFTMRGFKLKSVKFDDFREPEIWLTMEKV